MGVRLLGPVLDYLASPLISERISYGLDSSRQMVNSLRYSTTGKRSESIPALVLLHPMPLLAWRNSHQEIK